MSPGRIMPRTVTFSCWLFIKIWRSASTTRFPFGSTAITWPVRFVWNSVFEAVDPCPLSAEDELPDKSGLVDAGVLPMMPVIAEELVKLRSLSTVPDCAAVVWTAT